MKSLSKTRAGRVGWVLVLVALSAAVPSGQAPQAPRDVWSQLRELDEGARIHLIFNDGTGVSGRVVSVTDEAVLLREIRTGAQGVRTAASESEPAGYRFFRADVRSAEVLSRRGLNTAPQVAGNFDQLRMLLSPGQKVNLTDIAGERFSGTLTRITESTIDLSVGKEVRQFTESSVRSMRQRRNDSVRDGALWGAAVGAGVGFASCGRCHVPFMLTTAGLGAGIGAGIDALLRSEMVIFNGRGASATRVAVRPQLASSHKSVQLSIAW